MPGTDYYFEPQWRQAYSRMTESCLVKITTDSGLEGWGEAQAPLAPLAPCAILTDLVGPALLDQNPVANEAVYERLYHLMHVRGQTAGFMLDAIAGADTALWDIRGKHFGAPVFALLGGPFRVSLQAYVSGLRKPTLEERLELAREAAVRGFAGVKLFPGGTVGASAEEVEAVRDALGSDRFLAVDLISKYAFEDALRLGATLDRQHAAWIESPLDPDDLDGHRELMRRLSTPVAGGETLRSVQQFRPWLEGRALRVAQPDVMRAGITAARKIADLAAACHCPAALHVGVSTAIGVAATWQLAAALPNFAIQEHQPDMFPAANRVLQTPLCEEGGMLRVPEGVGLGVSVDEDFIRDHATEHWTVDHRGKAQTKERGE
jgi:L-alanine-DL-glutamate epimerase-like enolase superfamily enzyme